MSNLSNDFLAQWLIECCVIMYHSVFCICRCIEFNSGEFANWIAYKKIVGIE